MCVLINLCVISYAGLLLNNQGKVMIFRRSGISQDARISFYNMSMFEAKRKREERGRALEKHKQYISSLRAEIKQGADEKIIRTILVSNRLNHRERAKLLYLAMFEDVEISTELAHVIGLRLKDEIFFEFSHHNPNPNPNSNSNSNSNAVQLLKQAFDLDAQGNPTKVIGQVFWAQRGFFKCSPDRGILKKIQHHIDQMNTFHRANVINS